MITCIFESAEDKERFQELIKQDGTTLTAENPEPSTSKKGFLQANKASYNQSLEFWQLLILTISMRSLPAAISALQNVVSKYFETSRNKLTIQNGDSKIELEFKNGKQIGKFINEDTVRKLVEAKKSPKRSSK